MITAAEIEDGVREERLRQAAASAYERQREAESRGVRVALTRQERKDIAAWEEWLRYKHFWEVATALPQKIFLDLIETPKKVAAEYRAAGLHRDPKSKSYNLIESLPWLKSRWMKFGRGGEVEDRAANVKERKESAKAHLLELELARKRGEVVDAAEIKSRFVGMVVRARGALMNVPGQVAGKMEGLGEIERERVIEEAIREALGELARETEKDGHGSGGLNG